MTGHGLKRADETTFAYHVMVSSPFPTSLPVGASSMNVNGDLRDDVLEITEDLPVDVAAAEAVRPPKKTLQYFVRHYRMLEFGSASILYIIALVFATVQVHERPIPGIKVRLNATAVVWALDPSLDEKTLAEEVPMWLLLALGIGLPIATNITVNYMLPLLCQVRVIVHDTRDFLLSLFQSMALATFLTQFTKNITGRFRPSFYDMCKWNHNVVWDGVTNLCTDPDGEKEGRKSFPSGHASFAWATMLVFALYLLGRSRLNCENRSKSTLRGGKKSLMLFMCCAPVLLAAWISISRCIDNWHHYSDILAGSVIGAVSALFAFNYNYGSIFSWDSAGLPLEEIHERRMNAKKAKNKNVNQPPKRHSYLDSQPPMFKHMSSEHIVDLSFRSRESE